MQDINPPTVKGFTLSLLFFFSHFPQLFSRQPNDHKLMLFEEGDPTVLLMMWL